MRNPEALRLSGYGRWRRSGEGVEQPGLARPMSRLERGDRVVLLQGQADVVQAVEQAVLAEGVDLEGMLHAVGPGHRLRGEVDRQRIALVRRALREQRIDLVVGQHDRQQSVLEAVVVEDVGEAGRDDGAEAVFLQRPRRMFTRGAAAEVLARQQHAGTGIARKIEHEAGIEWPRAAVLAWLADVQIAPLVEQVRPEAAAPD